MRVGVLVFDGADELDVVGPYRVFAAVPEVSGEEVELVLVAEGERPVRLDKGIVVTPHVTYGACPPLDVLVVPGGGSRSETGRRDQQGHEPTLAFIRRHAGQAGRVTASVCTGAFLLGGAGLLEGRRANTHWTARDELREFMAARGEEFELVPERVVDAGDVVSGGGVTSGIDVAYHLVERLFGGAVRDLVRMALEAETP